MLSNIFIVWKNFFPKSPKFRPSGLSQSHKFHFQKFQKAKIRLWIEISGRVLVFCQKINIFIGQKKFCQNVEISTLHRHIAFLKFYPDAENLAGIEISDRFMVCCQKTNVCQTEIQSSGSTLKTERYYCFLQPKMADYDAFVLSFPNGGST